MRQLSRKDAAMLAMLALDGALARPVVAGRLWPHVDEQRAAASLRQRIARLRRDSGHPVLHTGDSVRLFDDIDVDALSVGTMDEDALLASGDLLAGFDYADTALVDGWVSSRREMLRRARAEALIDHAYRRESRGELAAALRLGECVVSLLPLNEHAWRHQMRRHYLRGDRSSAIQAFERFEALLRDETGARPSEETVELLRIVEAAQPSSPHAAAASVVPVSLTRPPRLVGREAAWLAMSGAWAAGRPFMIVAEAGMGKTRLLTDFAQEQGRVIVERGCPGDGAEPGALLQRILARAAAFPTRTAVGESFATAVDESPRQRSEPQAALPRTTLHQTAQRVLAAAVTRGLSGVVVDDLHLADRASVLALRGLCSSDDVADLRFGATARCAVASPMLAVIREWITDGCHPQRVELDPLTPEGLASLLQSLNVPLFTRPGLAEKLHRHTAGHPLFTLETLKDLFVSGTSDPLAAALPTPTTARALLDRRFDALSPAAQELLWAIVALGPGPTVERAARMLGRRPLELTTAWAELEAAHVLAGERFACDLVHDCARRRVPLSIVNAVEAIASAGLAPDPSRPRAARSDTGPPSGHRGVATAWGLAGQGPGDPLTAAGADTSATPLRQPGATVHGPTGSPCRPEARRA